VRNVNFAVALKVLKQYQDFKRRAKYYLQMAENIAAQLNDSRLDAVIIELKELYGKLP